MASERWPLIQADKIAARSPHLARTRLEARTARVLRVRRGERTGWAAGLSLRATAAGWRSVHSRRGRPGLDQLGERIGAHTGEDLTEACEGLVELKAIDATSLFLSRLRGQAR
jgi:hypothetical protein